MRPVLSREVTTDLTVLERLVPVSGRDVVDIGCGGGVLVRALTARGARAIGVEISESQLAAAIRDDDGNGARYVVGVAQRRRVSGEAPMPASRPVVSSPLPSEPDLRRVTASGSP
jgi:SAM-dependent methyltransferase